AYMDALNLLYVAFTRAEDCLVGFGPIPNLKKDNEFSIKKISDLLYKYFGENFSAGPGANTAVLQNARWDADAHQFEMGQRVAIKEGKSGSSANIASLHKYLSSSWRSRLSIKPRARNFYLEKETPA